MVTAQPSSGRCDGGKQRSGRRAARVSNHGWNFRVPFFIDRQNGLRCWSPADAAHPDYVCDSRERRFARRTQRMGAITAAKNKIAGRG